MRSLTRVLSEAREEFGLDVVLEELIVGSLAGLALAAGLWGLAIITS